MKNVSQPIKIVPEKGSLGFSSEVWSTERLEKKLFPTQENSAWPKEKVFSGFSSEFWSAAFSDKKRVPTLKNSAWPNEKVFSGMS